MGIRHILCQKRADYCRLYCTEALRVRIDQLTPSHDLFTMRKDSSQGSPHTVNASISTATVRAAICLPFSDIHHHNPCDRGGWGRGILLAYEVILCGDRADRVHAWGHDLVSVWIDILCINRLRIQTLLAVDPRSWLFDITRGMVRHGSAIHGKTAAAVPMGVAAPDYGSRRVYLTEPVQRLAWAD